MSAGSAATGGAGTPAPVHLMTMRVTRIRDGRVVERRAEVRIASDTPLSLYDLSSAWPPCRCPRHRDK